MSTKWGYKEAREFIRRRLGISHKEAADTLAAVRDYMLLAFLHGEEVSFPQLCTIHIKETKGNSESGTVLRGFIKLATKAKLFLSKYIDDSESEEVLELLNAKTPRRRTQNAEFNHLRSANKMTPVLFKPNEVRDKFMVYLQHEFPYKSNWVHPISGIEYEHDRILSIIETYQVIQPKNYKAFWGLWMGVENQALLKVGTKGRTDQLPLRWQHAIDYIILMLEYPAMTPAVEELISVRYAGNDDKDLPDIEE